MKKTSTPIPKRFITAYGLLAASAAIISTTAYAVLPAAPVTSRFVGLSTGNLGSSGSGEGWSGSSGNLTVTNGAGSLDGTALGLLASAGDRVFVNGTPGTNTYNLFATGSTFPQTTPVNLYYSFLYKFNSLTNVGDLSKVAQVNVQNSGSTFYWDLEARTNAFGKIELGIAKPGGTAAYATGKGLNAADTALVVI